MNWMKDNNDVPPILERTLESEGFFRTFSLIKQARNQEMVTQLPAARLWLTKAEWSKRAFQLPDSGAKFCSIKSSSDTSFDL